MPIGSWAHAQYWRFDRQDGGGPPGPSETRRAYPAFQAVPLIMIASSLFGGLQVLWERVVRAWRLLRQLDRLPGAQDAVLERVLTVLASPQRDRAAVLARVVEILESAEYDTARDAVQTIAQTPGFNKEAAWKPFAYLLRDRPDLAENHWRHLAAMTRLEATVGRLDKPRTNLLTELAYHGYALKPRART